MGIGGVDDRIYLFFCHVALNYLEDLTGRKFVFSNDTVHWITL
jgi:hypothetical protein